jgi:hypothetical protein
LLPGEGSGGGSEKALATESSDEDTMPELQSEIVHSGLILETDFAGRRGRGGGGGFSYR